jgi:hypothetical protein
MTDLRIGSSRISSIDRRDENSPNHHKYNSKREVPPHILEHKSRFHKLINGGEAGKMVKIELKLEDG